MVTSDDPLSQAQSTPDTSNLTAVPDELKQIRQWVCWNLEPRGEKTTKPLYNPHNPPWYASVDNPKSWGTLDDALQALPRFLSSWRSSPTFRYAGVGCVITAEGPYTGLDFDACRDPDSGTLEPWVMHLVHRFATYTEVSPSHTGVKLWVRGKLPGENRNIQPHLEIYDHGRYFTVTGDHVPGTPRTINDRQALVTDYYTIMELLSRLLTYPQPARHRFSLLFAGHWQDARDTHDAPYRSHSEADLAFLSMAYNAGGDETQRATLWRLSGLWRDKAEKAGYHASTIHKATQRQGKGHPRGRGGENGQHAQPRDATGPRVVNSLGWQDTANAEALVRDHGTQLRYCSQWKSWLVWTGTHWERDTSGAVMRRAKQTIKKLGHRAIEEEDDTLLKHVKRSLSTAALEAMIKNAQSEPGIAVQPEALDADPWLLNCANGTLEVQTGTLREHRQADLLTKCLAIPYDPAATCPTWERFLWRAMGGTNREEDTAEMSAGTLENRQATDHRATELTTFIQRAVGYSLTGSTREQCLFILHGPTKTGKSTFLATIRGVVGPYGKQAEMASFLHKDRDEVRNDLADLAGSRCVCALETQEGKRLAESLIKQLTGGVDRVKARFLFQEYFEYQPQFKVWLGTNHKPVIRDTDSAIWERIRLVPFVVQIPKSERDKTLEERLHGEFPGILAWAVQGCLEWQQLKELQEPAAVQEATQGYREEMDDLGRFLKEMCFVKTAYKTQAAVLLKAYQQWSGQHTETAKSFAAKLTERGYESKRGATGIFWQGIGFPEESEEEPSV